MKKNLECSGLAKQRHCPTIFLNRVRKCKTNLT